ncbi:NAD-dependent succinate-semialdehyde dehydrogenase [Enterovirga aerilata]|uniref:NAD-dependent succinate-semialdehyde dehydrogenase n=1 Tax=Enterovirga aerilata TaxID=2730920 RepID=A0A849ICK2_9HYPH|nr:NAD-dependent succinate-semialdehyde dehydrogenase [Enterovirga sp. DB1703]NNM74149.1 NAD-dependent succinate-semialdehyde dehydrogenase [Enterovirga sp. DB1703]
MYPELFLCIAGSWRASSSGDTLPVIDPATEAELGRLPVATEADLDEALAAARSGFQEWSRVSAFERGKVLRKAAALLRARSEEIAVLLTREQGKPLAQARTEVMNSADLTDWFAEEGRRTYGSVIPARASGVAQLVTREPVGPVVAFTPWNFPVSQSVRKIAAALCTGCSVILKGPEETPASCSALVRAFLDAGVPGNALGLVFGRPAEISGYLIPHPVVRKVSFTGSTAIGKQIAALAGQHMKRTTLELGGHAPAIVFDDADLARALSVLTTQKFRNAGQVCVSPTRFLVHRTLFEPFVEGFVTYASTLKVGNGLEQGVEMGPLAHERRLHAMEDLVGEAVGAGAKLRTGGRRVGNRGYFFQPTVLTDLPVQSRLMNEEPFGPVALIQSFEEDEEAFVEANRLPFGLAAYAYTSSSSRSARISAELESGMISINHHGLGLPEVPFGGIKDSGYGSEGGAEAVEGYLLTKFVSQT